MKRRLSFLLALLLLLGGLTACTRYPQETITEPPAETQAPAETADPIGPDAPAETEAPAEASAELADPHPLLWKVTDAEGRTLYLFGTIHVGDARSSAVLSRVTPVLDSCDALAVEFDTLAYAQDTQKAVSDLQQFLLTDGSSISDYLPEEQVRRASDLMQEAGLYPSLFSRYNLAMWSSLLDSAILMTRTELKEEYGMDGLLLRHAHDREIPVLEVESPDFQMSLLNSFDDEINRLSITYKLDHLDEYAAGTAELYELWLSGDRDLLWNKLIEEDETEAADYTEEQLALMEDYNTRMLDERNLGMRDKALSYLSEGKTVFFAVGAAHMANEGGLVQLLQNAGCTVEPIEY